MAVAVVADRLRHLRPLAAELGFAEYVDAWALSCDLGGAADRRCSHSRAPRWAPTAAP
ncbi:hypothetical protein ACFQX7_30195 [Luedemannella flava]